MFLAAGAVGLAGAAMFFARFGKATAGEGS
jgi:hypothetical protein